ncbi:MAG: SGNH/GDSL hydrolase family protein [Planctomycetaceae bacterium]
MPMGSSYRLAGNSRSRRRMLVLRAAEELKERQARRLARAARDASQSELEANSTDQSALSNESVGAAVPELVAHPIAQHPDTDPSTHADTPEPDPNNDRVGLETDGAEHKQPDGPDDPDPLTQDGLATIRQLVDGPRPATWVFCGDGPPETGFPDQFAAELRTTHRRPLDVVVNTLVPGSPIETVLENLEWQLARFHPDVVNLVVGPSALSAESDFAETLTKLVDQLQDLEAALVIHTPEPDPSADNQARIDQIRSLARERNIPLVDQAGAKTDQDRVNRLCQALEMDRPGG